MILLSLLASNFMKLAYLIFCNKSGERNETPADHKKWRKRG